MWDAAPGELWVFFTQSHTPKASSAAFVWMRKYFWKRKFISNLLQTALLAACRNPWEKENVKPSATRLEKKGRKTS